MLDSQVPGSHTGSLVLAPPGSPGFLGFLGFLGFPGFPGFPGLSHNHGLHYKKSIFKMSSENLIICLV